MGRSGSAAAHNCITYQLSGFGRGEPICHVLNSVPGVVKGGISAPVCPISLLQVDSWALGVLLYTLVYGTMPFDGFDHKNLIRQISSGEYREPTQPSGACPERVSGRAGVVGLPSVAHTFLLLF